MEMPFDITNFLVLKRPIHETYAYIDQLDLNTLKIKVCKKNEHGGYGWPEDSASFAVEGYRTFLKHIANYYYTNQTDIKPIQHIEEYMRLSAGDSMPFMVIDIIWHTHILSTEKYFEDCKKVFGFYLHHTPDA